jgi:hypothetical protein
MASLVVCSGCFGTSGMAEIKARPYHVTYEDDSTLKMGDADDTVSIEIRRISIPRQLPKLAIHYNTLFPGGENIRPGDSEEYVKIGDKEAFKVSFRPDYIRLRKRAPKSESEEIPPNWAHSKMEDPKGEVVPVIVGPVVSREKTLYLVQGDKYLYYIFFRADGDTVKSAGEKFKQFIQKDINYL